MHYLIRLQMGAALLLTALVPMSAAWAEGPLLMPEPIPPAVVGRPLDRIRPPPRLREKPVVARPLPARQAKAAPAAPRRDAPSPAVAARSMGANAAPAARPAKQAVDDRAGGATLADDVGKGTHFARKRLAPGAYISDKYRIAVRRYFDTHPVRAAPPRWQIGDPLPRGATPRDVPAGLLASLPEQPPGLRYLQLGGDVVLVAEGSNMVVDGVSRRP